jgi:hypothetical protein
MAVDPMKNPRREQTLRRDPSPRRAGARVASVMVVAAFGLMASGAVEAVPTNYSASGDMTITQIWTTIDVDIDDGSATSPTMDSCGGGVPKWWNGDTFTFTSDWLGDNSAGSDTMVVGFLLEIYVWDHGAPGSLLDSDDALNISVPIPGEDEDGTRDGTLSVSATYTGWNGNPACEASFHVYRHAGSPTPGNAYSDWY